MFLKVLDIQVISDSYGPDNIFLEVNLPKGHYPYTGHATLKMTVASGTGPEYVKRYLTKEKTLHIKRKDQKLGNMNNIADAIRHFANDNKVQS